MGIFYIPYATLNTTFLYAYFVSILNPKIVINRKIKWFFIPFIFFLIVTTIFKLAIVQSSIPDKLYAIYNDFANFHEFFAALYSFAILIVGYIMIKRYEKSYDTFDFKIIKQQLTWLKITIAMLFVVVFLYLYLMVRVLINPDIAISFYALWIGNSFMIYWLGHIGIYKYGIHKERKEIRKFSKQVRHKPMKLVHKHDNIHILEALMFQNKRFLDPNISLDSIASELGLSSGHLSRVINAELQVGFSDYVNKLRVEEAKSYLSNPDFQNYTLSAIGLEAGFNSKSTFYSTFKKITGCTPLQFKNNLEN